MENRDTKEAEEVYENIFLENYQGIVDKMCKEYNLPHHGVFFSYRLSKCFGKVAMTTTKTKETTIKTGDIKITIKKDYKIILNLRFIALNHMDAIIEVLRHELAHTKAGVENKHNAIFKKVCKEMGNVNPMGISSYYTPVDKYVYECPVCKKAFAYRKRLGKAYSCKCAGGDKYNPKYKLVCVNKLINNFLKLFKKYIKNRYGANLNEIFAITNFRNL